MAKTKCIFLWPFPTRVKTLGCLPHCFIP